MTSEAEHVEQPIIERQGRISLEEQVRRRRLRPIESVDDLRCEGVFDTDDELDEFLAFTYAARRADLA
jgi:hypothetical protein